MQRVATRPRRVDRGLAREPLADHVDERVGLERRAHPDIRSCRNGVASQD
jgi:hypothetical protein